MKCPQDTAFPLCRVYSDHRLSAPFTDLCLLHLLHCHWGYTLSTSLIWLFINYNVVCQLEGHELCQTAYWHFYSHDFVFLPFNLMFFWDRCLIYEGCKVIWSLQSKNFFELCFLNVWQSGVLVTLSELYLNRLILITQIIFWNITLKVQKDWGQLLGGSYVLCHHISTVDHDISWFYPDIKACIKKYLWDIREKRSALT